METLRGIERIRNQVQAVVDRIGEIAFTVKEYPVEEKLYNIEGTTSKNLTATSNARGNMLYAAGVWYFFLHKQII